MKKIIISRVDNIGDVILTFPLVGFLKKIMPNCTIIFIGKNYTKDLCLSNQHIDQFINFSDYEGKELSQLTSVFNQINADYILHIFPNPLIAKAAKQAKIPNRIGTLNRFFHWLSCNQKVSFTRKNSDLHEAQLNFNLLTPLIGKKFIPKLDELAQYYGMPIKRQRDPEQKIKLIFHTKSFGSAVDWELENYIQLAKKLNPDKFHVYFSGTDKESALISPHIQALIKLGIASDMTGKFNLKEFIQFIAEADMLIACSTGPLHIAASLGLDVIGLYSSHRPIHAGRWSPIGIRAQYLLASDEMSDQPNINLIEPIEVFKLIERIYLL
jgi:ADP-heptose:LPS heptosyltransferase